MPTLANLRKRFAAGAPSHNLPSLAQDESLITDLRCRISPVQAIDRKLGMMLGREKLARAFGLTSAKPQALG